MNQTPFKDSRRICVAMISRNEEKAVGQVIDEIWAAVPDASILLVDSSTDRTAEIAEQKGAIVIRQVPPRGYGPAMDAALRTAAERSDVVVTMDCDGTYPAAMIPELARMVLEGECDLANASRLVRRPRSMPFANWLANKTFAVVTYLLHGLRVSDVHSGMRAYRSSMLLAIRFRASGAALPVELLIKPARLGYKVREIGIDYRDRIGVTTLQRFNSTIWTFRRIFSLLSVSRRVA